MQGSSVSRSCWSSRSPASREPLFPGESYFSKASFRCTHACTCGGHSVCERQEGKCFLCLLLFHCSAREVQCITGGTALPLGCFASHVADTIECSLQELSWNFDAHRSFLFHKHLLLHCYQIMNRYQAVGPRASKEEFLRALGLHPSHPQADDAYRQMRVSLKTKLLTAAFV